MRIYDITRTMQEAPVYFGEEAPEIIPDAQPRGGFYCSKIKAGSHSGTHADAFSHLLPDGLTIDKMPLENYCGACRVLTVPHEELIKQDDLVGKLSGTERIALRSNGISYLCEEAAEYIVHCGMRAVITDSVSVGPTDNEASIHRTLMEGGVAIIENAVLNGVPDGDYFLFAFPVKYGGCDAAPVRAVLISGEPSTGRRW